MKIERRGQKMKIPNCIEGAAEAFVRLAHLKPMIKSKLMGSEGSLDLSDLRKKESQLVKPPGKDQSNLGLGLATNTGP